MKIILILILPAFIAGCATTKQYFHTSLTNSDEIKRRRVIDDAECTRIAIGSVPTPQVNYVPSPSSTSSGTITGYSDGKLSTYNYTATKTGAGSFSRGFANGENMGAAIAAGKSQRKIHHGCMVSKGWSDNQDKAAATAIPTAAQPSESETANQQWRDTINQFMATEAMQPNGIDYRKDEYKLYQLDTIVKQLANEPKHADKTMLWFLMEADKIVKRDYSPERTFLKKAD